MHSIETIISENSKGYTLQGTVITLDNDDIVVIIGGGHDHIGALSLSVPRPSLDDADSISATSSVLTMPSHKDDEPAKYVGDKIAAATNRNVAVIAGIHYDNLAFADLETLRRLWISLTGKIITFINQP